MDSSATFLAALMRATLCLLFPFGPGISHHCTTSFCRTCSTWNPSHSTYKLSVYPAHQIVLLQYPLIYDICSLTFSSVLVLLRFVRNFLDEAEPACCWANWFPKNFHFWDLGRDNGTRNID